MFMYDSVLDQQIVSWLQPSSKEEGDMLNQFEQLLLQGNREAACQLAVDHAMWGHAFVVASVDPDQLKRLVPQFISQGFHATTTPEITEQHKPLRMLYSILHGLPAEEAGKEK